MLARVKELKKNRLEIKYYLPDAFYFIIQKTPKFVFQSKI